MLDMGVAEVTAVSALMALFFMREIFSKEKSFLEEYKRIQSSFALVKQSNMLEEEVAELKKQASSMLIARAVSRIAHTLIVLTGFVFFWTIFFIGNIIFNVS